MKQQVSEIPAGDRKLTVRARTMAVTDRITVSFITVEVKFIKYKYLSETKRDQERPFAGPDNSALLREL